MDWKDLSNIVGKAAPILGTLIGGPGGAAVGSLIASALGTENTPDSVHAMMASNPDAAVKLADIEAKKQTELQSLLLQHESARIAGEVAVTQAVNTTMQAEAKADHWPTYSWRPFIGFCVGFNTAAAAVLVLMTFVATIVGAKEAASAVAQLPMVLGALAAISATVLPILGIASYFRGKAQADPSIATDNRG